MKNILITGARGQLGSAAMKILRAKGFKIKAASRKPREISSAHAEIPTVFFDYEDPSTYEAAFSNVHSLLLIAPPLDPEAPEKLKPFIIQAKHQNISRIVFISTLGADKEKLSPLRRIEEYVVDSGITYVILRPNFFMDNFSSGFIAPMVREKNGIFLAANGGKTSFIAAADIAKAISVAFMENINCRAFNLSGPESLDHSAVARMISEVTGKNVLFYPISEKEMIQDMVEKGMPEHAAQYLSDLYQSVRSGKMAPLHDDFNLLVRERPTHFSAFARKQVSMWQ